MELKLPEDPIISRLDATALLGLTTASLSNWKNRRSKDSAVLKMLPDGRYDLRDIANFILKRTTKGRHDPTLRPKAKQILAFYPPQEGTPSKVTVAEPTSKDLGIEHALKRVQSVEVELAKKVEEAYLDPGELVVAITNWNKILEILRKTETDCLKVLEEKKVLVRIDDVREIYDKGILPAKTKLRQIPSVIAQDLVGLDRADIEELLEREIDRALEDVSNIWNS